MVNVGRLSFSTALAMLKRGHRIAREGWNGKGMWLALWSPGTYKGTSELFENAPALREHAVGTASKSLDVAGCIVMHAADGSIVFGWLASQTDMLADDWIVLTDTPAATATALREVAEQSTVVVQHESSARRALRAAREACANIVTIGVETTRSRALVLTKLDEAIMWFDRLDGRTW